jgi:hypothetical protein
MQTVASQSRRKFAQQFNILSITYLDTLITHFKSPNSLFFSTNPPSSSSPASAALRSTAALKDYLHHRVVDLLSNNKPLDAIKVLESTTIRGKRIAVRPKPETLSLYFDALSRSGLDNQTVRDKAVAAHAMGATSFLIQDYIQNLPVDLSNSNNIQQSSSLNTNVDFYPQHKDKSSVSKSSSSGGGGGGGGGRYPRDHVRLHSSREKHLNTLDAITEEILGQTTSPPCTATLHSNNSREDHRHHHTSQTVDVVVGKIIQGSGSPHIVGTRLDGEVLLEKLEALVDAVEAAITAMKKNGATTPTTTPTTNITSKSILKGLHAAGGLLVQGIESKLYMALLDPGGLMFRRATDLLLRIEKMDNYLTLGSYKVLIRALLKQKRFKEVLPILGRYTTCGGGSGSGTAAPKRHPSPPESLVQTCQDLAILGVNVLDEFYYNIEDYIGDGDEGSSTTTKRAALSDEEKQGLVTALNIIITACGFGGDAQRAKETLDSIKKLGLTPTRQSYDAAAFSYMFSNNVSKAWGILSEAAKDLKLPKSHGTYCIEVELLGIEGKLEEAVDMLLLGADGAVFEEGEDFERTIRRCERAGEEGLLDRLLRRRYPNYKMEEREYESIVSVQTRWRGVPGWRGLLYGSEGAVVRVKLMKEKAGGEVR